MARKVARQEQLIVLVWASGGLALGTHLLMTDFAELRLIWGCSIVHSFGVKGTASGKIQTINELY